MSPPDPLLIELADLLGRLRDKGHLPACGMMLDELERFAAKLEPYPRAVVAHRMAMLSLQLLPNAPAAGHAIGSAVVHRITMASGRIVARDTAGLLYTIRWGDLFEPERLPASAFWVVTEDRR